MKPFQPAPHRGFFFACDLAGADVPVWTTLIAPPNGDIAMPSPEYSLPDILERISENQLALEAALMELTLLVEGQGNAEAGSNVRGALETIGENAGHIRQGLARLKQMPRA